MKLRKDRNPRYQTALDLAETNNGLMKQQTNHNYNTVLELADIRTDLKKLTNNTLIRNEKLTDAYLKLSARYWDMLNKLTSRESRLDLVTQQLRNYVPDHWMFEDEDSTGDAEDNKKEPEPEHENQIEFDFGTEFKTKH
jgi:hypothetical protein|tara:strand:+ start:183 stop:599 length:417 start_codon:yes stop_codon:yes gene_type:complete